MITTDYRTDRLNDHTATLDVTILYTAILPAKDYPQDTERQYRLRQLAYNLKAIQRLRRQGYRLKAIRCNGLVAEFIPPAHSS